MSGKDALRRRPLWLKQLGWRLTGQSGRTIGWRIKFLKVRYAVGVKWAERVCSGNRYGAHTPSFPAKQPLGGPCLCSRVRRRLDYIPF